MLEVCKLVAGFPVFVYLGLKHRITITMFKSHAALARNALQAVFKKEVLETHSLQGKRLSKDKEAREGLNYTGLQAVLAKKAFLL